MCVLIHVDDIMFVGSKEYVLREFIPEMKKVFDISEQHLEEDGSSFQFLRRTYEKVENGLKVHPGKYAENMVEAYESKMGKAKIQKLPCGPEILEPDGTTLLGYELASLYRSLVGCGIYLSQERLDVSYTVKELASTMSCPTAASLRKLGKLIGYLKHTMGQHSLLELNEPGHGLVHQSFETRWILETFSDSDWSGAKGHRRSTSSAIHMVNGVVVASSSRGQKSVSLSSAEAELNALVSSAADGIYLRRCLSFLIEEEVEHCCMVDNSAALHLCHRKGPGKLRHVSGKLLWIQGAVLQEQLKVMPVGTAKNVADLGTKPLSKNRVNLLLNWCGVYNGQGERIGQDERVRNENEEFSKSRINRLAKLLNRILLLEGLGQVAGEVAESEAQCVTTPTTATSSTTWWAMWVIMIFLVMIVGGLAFAGYKMWQRLQRVLEDLEEMKEAQRVDGMMIDAFEHERKEETAVLGSLIQKIHRGLVKANGYVDEAEFEDGEWQHWDYIQKSNRKLDFLKLKQEAKSYLLQELDRKQAETSGEQTDVAMSEEEDLQLGDTATVRLESGEVVSIPMEYLEPREPESEAEEDASMNARERSEKRTVDGVMHDRSMTYDAKKACILSFTFQELGDLNSPAGRSGMRAKKHLQALEARWWDNQEGKRNVEDPKIFKEMEKHSPFLDSPSLNF